MTIINGKECEMAQILIIDRQPLFVCGMQTIITEMGEQPILATMGNASDFLEQLQQIQPAIALIDMSLAFMNAIEVSKVLREYFPGIRLVFLTILDDEVHLYMAIKAGAVAYLNRYLTESEYREAFIQILAGKHLISTETLQEMQELNTIASSSSNKDNEAVSEPVQQSPLSAREIEILDHIAQGHSNKEIASHLGISDQTVKNHITSILKKLQVNDRTAAVVHALRNEWILLHS
jgi:DNA-binding NarL/FixJ family response regulator